MRHCRKIAGPNGRQVQRCIRPLNFRAFSRRSLLLRVDIVGVASLTTGMSHCDRNATTAVNLRELVGIQRCSMNASLSTVRFVGGPSDGLVLSDPHFNIRDKLQMPASPAAVRCGQTSCYELVGYWSTAYRLTSQPAHLKTATRPLPSATISLAMSSWKPKPKVNPCGNSALAGRPPQLVLDASSQICQVDGGAD